MFPVKDIIAREIAKLKSEIEKFFEKDEVGLDVAEVYFTQRIGETVRGLLTACYEQKDAELLADKARRKEAGLVVERRGDARQVVTQLGVVSYHRTYYASHNGGYCYPIDQVVGLESYQRVSSGVGLGLVESAREMSYAKASRVITGGLVTKQTVMRKIREAVPAVEPVVRQKISVLHVDADEDHVKLQTGDSRIVPLVSVYEGIERNGKRGVCKNVFHCSEFGKKTEDLWEEVLTEMERRYDLTNTKIYLHGDGAPWIKAGLEWLPNSVFVLDRYHVNKALKGAVSGIERKSGCQYEYHLRQALNEGDRDYFRSVRDSLLARWPERKKTILENSNYLLDHFEAIHIYNTDPEARKGGATEPHVSHVLSRRLSSRPMGWSAKTLKKFVPILAAGQCTFQQPQPLAGIALKTAKLHKKAAVTKVSEHSLGLPHPDMVASMPAKSGKVTPLYRLLNSLNK